MPNKKRKTGLPIITYDVLNCSGIASEENVLEPCPFYDDENESEYCPLGKFFIQDIAQLPKDCPLKERVVLVRLKAKIGGVADNWLTTDIGSSRWVR